MLAELLTAENISTFLVLTVLETVLGFDNLLYISIEAKRVDPKSEAFVRRAGIILAIGLRIVLLFVVLQLINLLKDPFLHINIPYFTGAISGHALIVLVGGVFLIYTATKEIYHMLSVPDLSHGVGGRAKRTIKSALVWIVLMNIVFSFDTVISAVAFTSNFPVMVLAIIVSGLLMVVMADNVSAFLKKNRMYEVLGLFVLLLVGFMLMSDGGHIAELVFFGYPVEPISKSTFYFALVTLVIVEIVQGRYQRKIMIEESRIGSSEPSTDKLGDREV